MVLLPLCKAASGAPQGGFTSLEGCCKPLAHKVRSERSGEVAARSRAARATARSGKRLPVRRASPAHHASPSAHGMCTGGPGSCPVPTKLRRRTVRVPGRPGSGSGGPVADPVRGPRDTGRRLEHSLGRRAGPGGARPPPTAGRPRRCPPAANRGQACLPRCLKCLGGTPSGTGGRWGCLPLRGASPARTRPGAGETPRRRRAVRNPSRPAQEHPAGTRPAGSRRVGRSWGRKAARRFRRRAARPRAHSTRPRPIRRAAP
jgi:hypothetical protein